MDDDDNDVDVTQVPNSILQKCCAEQSGEIGVPSEEEEEEVDRVHLVGSMPIFGDTEVLTVVVVVVVVALVAVAEVVVVVVGLVYVITFVGSVTEIVMMLSWLIFCSCCC